ncbi:MAG: endonuclease/exonuclease/phosphatase family protein [Magnetovibrio sp.]|nr:endonuclease/exonuclease/phosphatase family protein [Magnetovibrio sp.]
MIIASYNIQYGTGKDGEIDLARIAGELGDADIIALQEVERFFSTTGMVDQAAAIAELFPKHFWTFGPGVDLDASRVDADGRVENRRRQFGNMLLSRWPILSSRNHLLPKFGMVEQLALQRSILEGVIETAALGPVRVHSVHLGHAAAPERRNQIGQLNRILREAPGQGGVVTGRSASKHWTADGPLVDMPRQAVFLGDFNLTPDDPEYDLLVGPIDPKYGRISRLDGLVDAWLACGNDPDGGATCGSGNGPVRIDYAFLTPDLADTAKSMWVDADAQGSDHQPIFVEF